jgi:hypothetical protein
VGFLRDLELSSDDRCRQRPAAAWALDPPICRRSQRRDHGVSLAYMADVRPGQTEQNPRSIIQPVIGTAEHGTARARPGSSGPGTRRLMESLRQQPTADSGYPAYRRSETIREGC